jgi:hypothetical protein
MSMILSQQGRPDVPRQQVFIQGHPQQRPLQQFSPLPVWHPAPTLNSAPQLLPKQNTSVPNLNVKALSDDLLRLKEQLRKLTERGEEMGASRVRAEEAHSARVRL